MQSVTRAALAVVLLVVPLEARADTCVKPDLAETYPPDGAKAVPPNATLVAHYLPTAEYLDETVFLAHGDAEPEPMPVSGKCGGRITENCFDSAEGLLSLTPPNALVPGDTYTVEWPKLRGIGTASLGRGAKVTFTVGATEDTAAPVFDGLTGVDWDVDRSHDDCTDNLEERFTFDFAVGPATDDGGAESLRLVVFQASGGELAPGAPPRQVLVAPYPGEGNRAHLERPISASSGDVCFAAHVLDLTGRESGGAEHTVCVHATPPPFFYGCSAARGASRSRSSAPWLFLGATALVLLRRRRQYSALP